jgi:hypothetical protein
MNRNMMSSRIDVQLRIDVSRLPRTTPPTWGVHTLVHGNGRGHPAFLLGVLDDEDAMAAAAFLVGRFVVACSADSLVARH